jgi:hypothetical protein
MDDVRRVMRADQETFRQSLPEGADCQNTGPRINQKRVRVRVRAEAELVPGQLRFQVCWS